MKIGILVCDHVEDHLKHIQGGYDRMYSSMLAPNECHSYFVCDGQLPESANECDVWLVGGSKYSVYDDELWIRDLKTLVVEIKEQQKKYIGICFGHQMLAEALNGKVAKAPSGWCLGNHTFSIVQRCDWMVPFDDTVNVLMLCQDQVERLPSESQVVAASDRCPVAMYTVGPKMLGIQGHPEFSIEYKAAIVEARRHRYGNDHTDAALESLGRDIHHDILTQWILNFISNNKK